MTTVETERGLTADHPVSLMTSVNMAATPDEYDDYIERMRVEQYPMLAESIYMDHAGTTLYSKRLMEHFQTTMMSDLFGNPHCASLSSQKSSSVIDDTRVELLRFFKADPEFFDLVFTSNATAAVKLVAEALREQPGGFYFGYHADSHTSLVGVREVAAQHHCFESDREVDRWIERCPADDEHSTKLFAYPLQSNMNGRRLSLEWCKRIRQAHPHWICYSLVDAAAFASTSALDLSDLTKAPDFTALSLYKIFGFPDLGALIVRKDAAHLFDKRRYFGGGTVDLVVSIKEQWHISKIASLHERLEDGTQPVHNILAVKSALQSHYDLFGPFESISRHCASLTKHLYDGLVTLAHGNGRPVCSIYKHPQSHYGEGETQGPIVAFNLQDRKGAWVSNAEVEKLASIKNVHLRTGGVCNPGGIAQSLGLAPWEMHQNFSAGFRCGSENDIMNGKPTGVIRVSLGAMSTKADVSRFLDFISEFFVDNTISDVKAPSPMDLHDSPSRRFHIDSLIVYPIKSCAGWQIPEREPWDIRDEGLAWDREWCIVHQGTTKVLSQKLYPKMALIRPFLDFRSGLLRVTARGTVEEISVPLSKDPNYFETADFAIRQASVCGDSIEVRSYTSPRIAEFLSRALGVPCTLARFPAASKQSTATRHSKTHLRRDLTGIEQPRRILLSNESPILTISRSSLNRLNEEIKAKSGKAAHPSVFRANIVLAESPLLPPGREQPWAEDCWREMRVGGNDGPLFQFLGGCRRCQMVCIDQASGERNQEPFVTLAKMRKIKGRILFGVHTALSTDDAERCRRIKSGDIVETFG